MCQLLCRRGEGEEGREGEEERRGGGIWAEEKVRMEQYECVEMDDRTHPQQLTMFSSAKSLP